MPTGDSLVAVIEGLPDPDYPVATPTREVTGVVRTLRGDPVANATVNLYRTRDDVFIARTTSALDGRYSFARDESDPETYYVVAFLSGTPEIHGASDRAITPTRIGA